MSSMLFTVSLVFICGMSCVVRAESDYAKIAIIKADDIRKPTSNWDRFFAMSTEKGIKISAGVICNSLAGNNAKYVSWLQKYAASGQVEFWNHGWDHKRWDDANGLQLKEFKGSGYAHQRKHFSDSQEQLLRVLGKEPVAFGAPYNAMDDETKTVLQESSELRLVFCYGSWDAEGKIPAPMRLRGEHDGTGKPNFAAFKKDYQKKGNVAFSAIQFHPNNFGKKEFNEYGKIIDFLIAEGWTFMLPFEYVEYIEKSQS